MIPKDLLKDYLIDQEDGLKNLLTWFLNLVMQFEAMEQIDAEPYQRVDSRKAHRNGYKERSLKTRVGELRLKKPQFREIPFQTKVFDRYSRVEKALINAIVESYLQGVSTRRIQDIVSRLGIEELSASSVSRIAVNGNLKFLNRGKIKFPTCKFLTSKLRSCVDANREEVPHVERFIRRRFKHQRDCSANRLRP